FDITLDNDGDGDQADLADTISMTGKNVSLFNASNGGTTLAKVTASGGDLTITSRAGAITDTEGEAITASGSTVLTASDDDGTNDFDIALDNNDTGAGDIHDFGGPVSAKGNDTRITAVNALTLGTVDAVGGLT